jgi:hypothetical protein
MHIKCIIVQNYTNTNRKYSFIIILYTGIDIVCLKLLQLIDCSIEKIDKCLKKKLRLFNIFIIDCVYFVIYKRK